MALSQAQTWEWTLAATGDWSWLYRSSDGERAWRITPFDPAFRVFADLCLASSNCHFPHIDGTYEHADGGYSVIMEWLDPVTEAEAKEWLGNLENAVDGELAEARRLLEDAAAQIEIPLFVGVDKNPDNVLWRPSDGTFVFADAYWINGPALYEMIQTSPRDALDCYPADSLEQWAYLPCMDAPATASILRAIGREPTPS